MAVRCILVVYDKDHIRYTVSYINKVICSFVKRHQSLGAESSSFANGLRLANQWTKFAPRLQQLSHIEQDCACHGSQMETVSDGSVAELLQHAAMQGPPSLR